MKTQSKLIDYFHRCYRADNYGIAISDVSRLSSARHIEVLQSDDLASGILPRIPIINPNVTSLVKQVDKYRKERLLVYACFFVTGQVESNIGFSSSRRINSPLVYFPARISKDEEFYLKIDTQDLRINRPLLRQLLKPELDTSVLETFPTLVWPIAADVITQLTSWVRKYTRIEETEELGRWPKLLSDVSDSSPSVTLRCACSILLAERSKGSRGVLHELKELSNKDKLSLSLEYILDGDKNSLTSSVSEPEFILGSLSKPQLTALDNASRETISMVSGPPGTGKSYTIAAIAIDRMLQGETVLIVSKSNQAINVVGEKLFESFGLNQGYVHTAEANFLKSIKEYLETLLSQGVDKKTDVIEIKKDLNRTQRKLEKVTRVFERKLVISRWISSKLAQAKISQEYSSLFSRVLKLLEQWVKPKSLWQYPDQISNLQQNADRLRSCYINSYRENRLHTLLDSKRTEISKFLQALKARSSKTQDERFAQTNLNNVLEAFPIWLVNVNDLNRVLPLSEGLFDLVIFDEATQCDIATSLPALYRAKRAVIVGDKKQLRHVSFVSRAEQQSIYEFCGLGPAASPQFSYRDQSILDLASDVIQSQSAVCMLDEYYRGKVDLIAFSNEYFYSSRLKVMRSRPGEIVEPALSFIKLDGERNKTGQNKKEADSIVAHIKSHIQIFESAILKPSVGVLSPYREQVIYLEKEILKAFSSDEIRAFKIRVDTPYGFQGEERDLMLLSMSVDSNSTRAAAYLNREDMFNVAVTRAKERMYVYHSVEVDDLSRGNLFRLYLEHDHLQSASEEAELVRCMFANNMSKALSENGYNCWVGFEIAGIEIDVVCQKGDFLLGIDLIGFPGNYYNYYDVAVYKTLHRAGIKVMPLAHSTWSHSRSECLELINTYQERSLK